MEILEQMFEAVIKDSMDQKNKIEFIKDSTILVELISHAKDIIDNIGFGTDEGTGNAELLKFIQLVKRYKPGYVIKDFKNMFDLGSAQYEFNFTDKPENMEQPINLSAQELFEKWFRVYGMRKHRHRDFQENKLYITNRNECLGLAYIVNIRRRRDFENINYSSLAEIKRRNGIEYMKKNFPNIIAMLKGDISIGIEIENIPVTNETPLEVK